MEVDDKIVVQDCRLWNVRTGRRKITRKLQRAKPCTLRISYSTKETIGR